MSIDDDSHPADRKPLTGGRYGPWLIEYVDEADSTNQIAATNAAPHRVVVTGHQIAGRGRMGRTWDTPAGQALTFSATVDPHLADLDWPWIPLLAGLSVAAALQDHGLDAGVKWPNDVMIDGLKIAGILVERVASASGVPLAVIGIGVNVHQREVPVPTATSLALCGVTTDRVDVLRQVLDRLEEHLGLAVTDLAALRGRFDQRCTTLGQQVDVHLPDGSVRRGRASALDPRGCLIVDTPEGDLVVSAGDVVHLRPAPPA